MRVDGLWRDWLTDERRFLLLWSLVTMHTFDRKMHWICIFAQRLGTHYQLSYRRSWIQSILLLNIFIKGLSIVWKTCPYQGVVIVAKAMSSRRYSIHWRWVNSLFEYPPSPCLRYPRRWRSSVLATNYKTRISQNLRFFHDFGYVFINRDAFFEMDDGISPNVAPLHTLKCHQYGGVLRALWSWIVLHLEPRLLTRFIFNPSVDK